MENRPGDRRPGDRRSFTRPLVLAATLAAGALTGALTGAWACGSRAVDPPLPARTIDAFSPRLTRDLTPSLARRRLGAPDVETGSGLMIHGYRLEAGRTLWLAFPGEAPIVYAQLEEGDGSRRVLPLH